MKETFVFVVALAAFLLSGCTSTRNPLSYQLRHHRESWAAIKGNPHVWG